MIRTPWKSQQSAPTKILPQCFHCLGESSFWGQIVFLQHPTDSAKTRAFCLKFKATISYFFLQPLLYITNWKVRASLLLTEDNCSDSHQCDQLVPCCLLRSTVGTCSGRERLGKSHRASDTEDASESYWHKELTGPPEWREEGRSWSGGNNSDTDISEVLTRKMK